MAHILTDHTGRCFCNCADKCVVEHKSGCMARCTKEEIEEAGHKVLQVYKDNDTRTIMDFFKIEMYTKKLKVKIKKIK